MENPPSSQCPTTDRGDDDRDEVRDGLGLDGQWKPQRVRGGKPGRRPVEVGKLLATSLPLLRVYWRSYGLSSWETLLRV